MHDSAFINEKLQDSVVCDFVWQFVTMAMLCPHHSSTGADAHGSGGSVSPKMSSMTTTKFSTTTMTCDKCGSTMTNGKTAESGSAMQGTGNGK